MFPGMFWVKYIFRVLHIGSLVTVCQAIINAKMTGQISKEHGVLYMVAGITVIISGSSTYMQDLSIFSSSMPKVWAKIENLG